MTNGELLIMLYDGLVKRLLEAQLYLEKKEYAKFEIALNKSIAIINYLSDTLDRKYPISIELARLYDFLCYELARVRLGRNKTELTRVHKMASELRTAFIQADKNTAAADANKGIIV